MNTAIDAWNVGQYRRGKSALMCTKCQKYTTVNGSYSNQGRNVICIHCAREEVERQGISLTEYLQCNVWV